MDNICKIYDILINKMWDISNQISKKQSKKLATISYLVFPSGILEQAP